MSRKTWYFITVSQDHGLNLYTLFSPTKELPGNVTVEIYYSRFCVFCFLLSSAQIEGLVFYMATVCHH